MELPYAPDTFTQEAWEKVFGAFVIANKSHWRGAPYDAVMNLLKTKGRFEFTVTGMGTWTSKFLLTVQDGRLHVEFIPNNELSPIMQRHLAGMKERFEKELEKI